MAPGHFDRFGVLRAQPGGHLSNVKNSRVISLSDGIGILIMAQLIVHT